MYTSKNSNKMIKKDQFKSVSMPIPDGHPTYHKPRRNYWGNLFDVDRYIEDESKSSDYDYSDFDSEDNNYDILD